MCGTDEQKRLTASWLNIIGAGTISAGGVTQAVAVLIGDRVGTSAITGATIAAGCLVTGFSVHLLARQVLSGVADEGGTDRGGAPEGEDIGLSMPTHRRPKEAARSHPETLMDVFSRRLSQAGQETPRPSTDPPHELDSAANPLLFRSADEEAAMADVEPPSDPATLFPSDTDVDTVLYEFRGDAREAIRALLHDLAVLAEDFDAPVSHGFVRGGIPKLLLRKSA